MNERQGEIYPRYRASSRKSILGGCLLAWLAILGVTPSALAQVCPPPSFGLDLCNTADLQLGCDTGGTNCVARRIFVDAGSVTATECMCTDLGGCGPIFATDLGPPDGISFRCPSLCPLTPNETCKIHLDGVVVSPLTDNITQAQVEADGVPHVVTCECPPVAVPCDQSAYPVCDGDCTDPLLACLPDDTTQTCSCGNDLCPIPPQPALPLCDDPALQAACDDPAGDSCKPTNAVFGAGGVFFTDACICDGPGVECGPVDISMDAVGNVTISCDSVCPDGSQNCIVHINGTATSPPATTITLDQGNIAIDDAFTCGCPLPDPTYDNWVIADDFCVECACTCDLNGDGVCNLKDLVIFQGCFGAGNPPSSKCRAADLNCDGKINAIDFSIFVDLFLGVPPGIACKGAVRPVIDHLRWYGSWIDADFEPLTGGARSVDGWLVALHSDLPPLACPPLSNAAAKPFDYCCTLETCGNGFVCRPKGSSYTYNLDDPGNQLAGYSAGDMIRICGEVIPFDPAVCDTSLANVLVNAAIPCETGVSRPDRLIAQWAFAPGDVVANLAPTASGNLKVGWDGHPIWCYDADLPDACLVHDNRSPSEIGPNGEFLPKLNRTYWISFQAEVGHAVNKLTPAFGTCSNDPTVNCTLDADCSPVLFVCSNAPFACANNADCPTGGVCSGQPSCEFATSCSYDPVANPATQDFWGWHTAPPGHQHKDDAYMGQLLMGTPDEPCEHDWFYNWMGHLHCSDPLFAGCCDDPTKSIDMAFYLMDRTPGFCLGTVIPCSSDSDCTPFGSVECSGAIDLIHWCQPVNPGPPPPIFPPFTPVPPLTPVPVGEIDEMPDTQATMVVQFFGNPKPEPPIQMQGPTVVSRGNLRRGLDRGDCRVAGSSLQFCDPAGVACTTSGGQPGTCTQRPEGCECVPADSTPTTETIETEIIAMQLTSVGPTSPVTVRAGQTFGLPPSPGQVAGPPSIDFQVDSFFDVWIEVELVALELTLHNQAPIRVQAQIHELPPGNATYFGPLGGPVDLFDPQGQPVAQLLDISHFLPYKGGVNIHSDVDWLAASNTPCCDPDPSSATGCSQTQCPTADEVCLPTCISEGPGGFPIVSECDCVDEGQACHITINAAGIVTCAGGCPTAGQTCVGPFLADVDGDGVDDGWKCDCAQVVTGACCEQVAGATLTCIDNVTAANCNGTFHAGANCLGVQACCFQDGTCTDIDALCCNDLGGNPQGPGSTCADPGICGGDPCPLPLVFPWCDNLQISDCQTAVPGQTCLVNGLHFDTQGQPVIDECTCADQDGECGPIELIPNPTPPGGFRVSCKAVCPPGQNCWIHFDDGTGPVAQGTDVMDSATIPPDVLLSCACADKQLGACCYDGPAGPQCIDGVTAAQCQGVSGFYHPNGTCLGIESCCFNDGSCMNIDALCCDDLGGTPGGTGSACQGRQACCDPVAGTCTDMDAECCIASGGIPQGTGSNCTDLGICNPPVCPVPGNDPWCNNLQATDCVTSAGGTTCRPGTVSIDPLTGMLTVGSCDCFVNGQCGPITIYEQPPGVSPPYVFICEKNCPDPNDTCEVHIDGVPQGVVSLGSNWVPNGQVVSCDCVQPDAPCPLPGGTIIPVCQSVQSLQCTSPSATTDECLPKSVALDADGQIAGAKCECITDNGDCGPVSVVDTAVGIEFSCEALCPNPASQDCWVHENGISTGAATLLLSAATPGALITCDCEPKTTGACCYINAAGSAVCSDGLTQTDCDSVFGTFHAGDSCLGVVACCMPSGSCRDIDELCCEDFGGVPQPAGTDCTLANVCDPPLCPLQPNNPWCVNNQADCVATGTGTNCSVDVVSMNADETLNIDACACYVSGACGPISIGENPAGMPPYTFVCEKACPDPNDTCEVHIDGIAQGVVSIFSNQVNPGQQVWCDCVSPPVPCEERPYPTCGGDCPTATDLCVPDSTTQTCGCEPTGACCFDSDGDSLNDACTDGIVRADCPTGGVWTPGASCLGDVACCLPDGSCIDADALCCSTIGTPQPASSSCSMTDICEPQILCEDGPYPVCGGDCPVNKKCKPSPLTQMCRCVSAIVGPIISVAKHERFVGVILPRPGGPPALDGSVAALGGTNTAFRVTLVNMYDPGDPQPVNQPDYSGSEGEVRYLNLLRDDQGAIVTDCVSAPAWNTTYPCATVGCEPEWVDWASLFGDATVYLSGNALIPDSEYTIAHLEPSCFGSEATCTDTSDEVLVITARSGDSQPDDVVNVTDVVNTVDVVKQLFTSLFEYHVYVRKADPQPQFDVTNVTDVVLHVDALKLEAYQLPVNPCQ